VLLLLVRVRASVRYAFFHCAKAYLRSQLWDPSTWPEEEFAVSFAPYFSPLGGGGNDPVKAKMDAGLASHYAEVKDAVRARDSAASVE
jgi:hypothetical protein